LRQKAKLTTIRHSESGEAILARLSLVSDEMFGTEIDSSLMKKASQMSSRSREREGDRLLFVFNKKQQMLRCARNDR